MNPVPAPDKVLQVRGRLCQLLRTPSDVQLRCLLEPNLASELTSVVVEYAYEHTFLLLDRHVTSPGETLLNLSELVTSSSMCRPTGKGFGRPSSDTRGTCLQACRTWKTGLCTCDLMRAGWWRAAMAITAPRIGVSWIGSTAWNDGKRAACTVQ